MANPRSRVNPPPAPWQWLVPMLAGKESREEAQWFLANEWEEITAAAGGARRYPSIKREAFRRWNAYRRDPERSRRLRAWKNARREAAQGASFKRDLERLVEQLWKG